MSTHAQHAQIGILDSDGSVKAVYLHFDGHPEYAGLTLATHYNSPELANELIQLGEVSVLSPTIEHSIFYGRDRHESDTELQCYSSIQEWTEHTEAHTDYFYLFTGNCWIAGNR